MKLIEEKDLPFFPYNYKCLLEMKDKQPIEENTNAFYVEVKDLGTNRHFLNHYYFKPTAKYFEEHDL